MCRYAIRRSETTRTCPTRAGCTPVRTRSNSPSTPPKPPSLAFISSCSTTQVSGIPASARNLLDTLCQESGLRGRAGEKFHESCCAVAVGGRSRRRSRIACIILGIPRQRPGELRALVAIELDLRDGAETDLLALAVDDVLHHGGAVRVARLLPLDLNADAEPLEQLFEIEAGRCLVVDDRFDVEQSALERIGRRHIGLCGTVAHDDPDPDPSDRSAPRSVELAGLRQFLNEGRRRDHHIGGLAAADPLLDRRGGGEFDLDLGAGLLPECV